MEKRNKILATLKVVASARWVDLSISKNTDLQVFSHTTLGFANKGQIKRKYSFSSVGENSLLMLEVKGKRQVQGLQTTISGHITNSSNLEADELQYSSRTGQHCHYCQAKN